VNRLSAAHSGSIDPKHAHDVIAPQQAVELVSEHLGVAILTQPSTAGFHADGVVVRPLSDGSLCFETCVIMRTDNGSRLVNEYVRMFLRRYAPPRRPPKPTESSLDSSSLGLENANPAVSPLNEGLGVRSNRLRGVHNKRITSGRPNSDRTGG
jgi:hypothetical protein